MQDDGAKIIKFPGSRVSAESKSIKQADFSTFALAIEANQIDLAAKILSHLLCIDPSSALRAAKHYSEGYRLSRDDFQKRAMSIKLEIRAGENIQALDSIYVCFGLQGPQAIAAFESMRSIVEENN